METRIGFINGCIVSDFHFINIKELCNTGNVKHLILMQTNVKTFHCNSFS